MSKIGIQDSNVKALVKKCAIELGFDVVGITTSDSLHGPAKIAIERVNSGLMDGLTWYTEARVIRGSVPGNLLEGARSIIALGMSYLVEDSAEIAKGNIGGKVARYAWGKDYHKVIKQRMRELVALLEERLEHTVKARFYVDDGPMLDRSVAERAGIGWFGKNTNILTTSHGSWLFLGQIITDLVLEPDKQLKKSCGECTRCMPACPTGAIVAPYVLDNSKCISYLTIENRGPIPIEMRKQMLDWVFGCDICQEVCPVNRKVNYSREPNFKRGGFKTVDLIGLLYMTEDEFRDKFKGSALKRAKRVGLQRNACVALGNIKDLESVPALINTLAHSDSLVRGHAAWALGQMGDKASKNALELAISKEDDSWVREEIELALSDMTEH